MGALQMPVSEAIHDSKLQKAPAQSDCDEPFRSRARGKRSLKQPSLGEGKGRAASHDEVIQNLDIYQG
jgi:hypothetical protein